MLPKVQPGILQSEIPLGGWGRPLTGLERRRLARAGIACGERYIVVRCAVDTPMLGRLYEPDDSAEWHHPLEFVLA